MLSKCRPPPTIIQLKPSSSSPSTSSSGSLVLLNRRDFGRKLGRRWSRVRLLKVVGGQSPEDKWKLTDNIDANAVQERWNSLLSKTQNFLNEVALPLKKSGHTGKLGPGNVYDASELEEIFMVEQTIHSSMPNGVLSLAAVVSIEQFSRMNGLTGYKMQKIFKALVSEPVFNDARNLVEYCCFRFLSRDSSAIHPSLQDPAFQRLIFITMIAWQSPYRQENGSEEASFQGKRVREEAFVRIAPAVSGVADYSTADKLFMALAGDEEGISLSLWLAYVDELLKVHKGRESYQTREFPMLSEETILCIGSSRKRPVLKWENNMAWPGKVTLTDKALYFEAIGLLGQKDARRLDLTGNGLRVDKTKVGPLGSVLFDSAICISSSGPRSETLVLEFVDLGNDLRRDVWHAFVNEIIAVHKFISEFGPQDGDKSVFQVYGAQKGKDRAISSAINSIARLQALQFMRKLIDDPIKVVQFSYLQNAPCGDIVSQTLAVNFWGGPLIKTNAVDHMLDQRAGPSGDNVELNNHVFDIDGSVYLRRWMRSSSWGTSASINFWKSSAIKQGILLSKNLVVADATLVERASITCKEKFQMAQKTQATIDAAMIKGIPSNIDLFKELMLPLTIAAKNFEKLRRWEEPHLTISFLALSYSIIFRNLLSYVFPVTLMVLAAIMLILRGLKEQGRLGRSFGKVTIRDQPPSNTIQKIIAVKDAMRDVENYLQNMNVTLLKVRTVVLSGHPQITTEVAMVLLTCAAILLIIPFKCIAAFLLFDLFTRELEFRREMVKRFITILKERWDTVHAAPVVILPFESNENGSANQKENANE